jgi:dihydrofolate reductase
MKLVVTEFVSLDGVMEAPGGEAGYVHSGWVGDFHEPGSLDFKLQETRDAEALLLGRVTYEGFAGAWPERDGEFADKMNAMPKYVVSATLTDPGWNNTTVLDGDPMDAVAELRGREGGTLLVAGSRTLVHALHDEGLVDEYVLMTFPTVLGSGRRVFPDDIETRRDLELVDAKPLESGTVILTYRPA